MAGRKPSLHSKSFNREVSMEDKAIMTAAGQGNITHGFRHMLDCYQTLWNRGYRPHLDLEQFLKQQVHSEESVS
jgi:hypothetical protein